MTTRFPASQTLRRVLGTLALLGLFALPQAASAQSRAPRNDGDRVEQRVAQLDEVLDLTDVQASRVRSLFEAQDANRPAPGARRSGSPDNREAMRAGREAQRAEMDRQLADILTPSQMKRYQTLRSSRPQRGGQRGDGR